MKKKLFLLTVLVFGLSVALMSCVTTQVKPTDTNFLAPKITLESFEVPWLMPSRGAPAPVVRE